mmetsp:Transcript_31632/g.64288  ORF Transcript_31632/g.64288 Transcript_31632/m.64288 type:complete len:88 (-) Transcript_31632:772-1035(-)
MPPTTKIATENLEANKWPSFYTPKVNLELLNYNRGHLFFLLACSAAFTFGCTSISGCCFNKGPSPSPEPSKEKNAYSCEYPGTPDNE